MRGGYGVGVHYPPLTQNLFMVIIIKLKSSRSNFGYGVGVLFCYEITIDPKATEHQRLMAIVDAEDESLERSFSVETLDIPMPEFDKEARRKFLLSELELLDANNN